MAQYQPTPQEVSYSRAAATYGNVAPIRAGQNITQGQITAPQSATTTRLSLRQRAAILIAGADVPNVLFAPQQPLQPIAQEPSAAVVGRPWDYPVGWNTRVQPRSDAPVTFQTLKAFADGYDVLRGLIERVKDKVCSQPWSVQPIKDGQRRDARCDEMEAFFAFPDRQQSWQDWVRQLMDQVIIYDAPAVWLRATRGGDLYSMEIQDGSLFQPKVMADGQLPTFDVGPAYQKVIKGLPAVDYIQPVPRGTPIPNAATGWPFPELLYKPRNKRVDSPYGYPVVEQMITTINIALAREAYLLGYYTNGSSPDMVWQCPEQWTTQDIANFKIWWDSILEGNLQNRRGTMFVPHGATPFDMKEKALTDETDQWLIRVMCFFLGLNPMPFIKMMNRATGQSHADQQQKEGLEPWLHWLTDFFGYVMRVKFGYNDLALHWDDEEATDPLEQAQIDQIMVNAKIYHPDEVRAQRGDEAMSPEMREQMDLATFAMTPNATVLPDDQQQAQNDHALAMQAAKPAPVVSSGPSAAQKAHELELAKLAQPQITVQAPQITLPASSPISVTTPPVTVNLPEIKAADVFVDVGATTVKIDAPRPGKDDKVETKITAERVDGKLVGTVWRGTTKVVTGERGGDGKLVAKLEE